MSIMNEISLFIGVSLLLFYIFFFFRSFRATLIAIIIVIIGDVDLGLLDYSIFKSRYLL
jgi:CHASE2 domain-containing sensor protein